MREGGHSGGARARRRHRWPVLGILLGVLSTIAVPAVEAAGAASDGARRAIVLQVPDELAEQDLSPFLGRPGSSCAAGWIASEDRRVYSTSCTDPPPYEIRIGALAPLTSYHPYRVVKLDELFVDLLVPPGSGSRETHQRLGGRSVAELLGRAFSIPDRFPGEPQCARQVKPTLIEILTGTLEPADPPCIDVDLRIPPAWRNRVRGRSYPIVEGCLESRHASGCLRHRASKEPIVVDAGPGWAPANLVVTESGAPPLSEHLRPDWPYALPLAGGRDGSLRALPDMVRYCYDVHGQDCCMGAPLAVRSDGGAEPQPVLPTLREMDCDETRPLPSFGLVTFRVFEGDRPVSHFGRYWTVNSLSRRPYRLDIQDARATHPLMLPDGDGYGEGARLALYPDLYSCQTAPADDYGVVSIEIGALTSDMHRVGLPVFGAIKAAGRTLTHCAEGVLTVSIPPKVQFWFVPR